jgi:hypothetical protein
MWNYPYLVAEAHTLKKINSQYSSAIYLDNKDALFASSLLSNTKDFLYPLNSLSEEWAQCIYHSYKYSGLVNTLLAKTKEISLEEWTKQYLITKLLEQKINNYSYRSDYVYYQLDGEKHKVKSDREKEYKVLVAVKAIREGYDIKVVKGSHFEVTTPKHKAVVTTPYNCSCMTYEQTKACTHLYLAQTLIEHRLSYGIPFV